MTADYLTEGVPCCSGCFCNHDAETMARWEQMFRESNEAAARLKAYQDELEQKANDERLAALHAHLARFRR